LQVGCANEIQQTLRLKTEEINVVTMPDFFLDRIVTINNSVDKFIENIEAIVTMKGGSLDSVAQAELRGGNAVNTASALAALGLRVTPIVCTDKIGSRLIKFYLDHGNADFSHIKIFGEKPSMTTALEFQIGKERANIMLRDVGALENFGIDSLDSNDFEAIENADYVCVFNWAAMRFFGTQLTETIFKRTKEARKGKTYLDTADPRPNKERIPQLFKHVLMKKNVDILSVNENEAFCYAAALNKNIQEMCGHARFIDIAKESARVLAASFNSRIDLHTTRFSGTFTKKSEIIVPTFRVSPLRTTGAGDAWDAGNIFGDAVGLPDESRLTLANGVAAYYVSSQEAKHPTRKQLSVFLKNAKPIILN
jgi:sugar/nucleoside kinase (ribokinase family)